MKFNAFFAHGESRPTISVGTRILAAGGLALTLGACSGLRLSDTAPRRPSVQVAEVALASQAPEMALRIANLAIAQEPGNARALVARGDALYALKDDTAAQQAYRAALAIDPGAVAALVGLGRTLVATDASAAETDFLRALQRDPNNVVALNNLGVVRDLQGRRSEAQEAYRRALQVSPASPDIVINLATSLALSGHTDDAVPLLRDVAENSEAVQAWRKQLINALTLAGDLKSAQQLQQGGSSDTSSIMQASTGPEERTPHSHARTLEVALSGPRTQWRTGIQTTAERDKPYPEVIAAESERAAAPRRAVIQEDLASTAVASVSSGARVSSDIAAAARSTDTKTDIPRTGDAERLKLTANPEIADGEPYVQLASLLSEADAMLEWRRLKQRMSEYLTDRVPTITSAEALGRTWWRLRTFGFASQSEAQTLCSQIKEAGLFCWTGRGL